MVLDTKWKNIGTYNPSDDDLKQMYVYSKFHQNAKTALVYPGLKFNFSKGTFFHEQNNSNFSSNICGIVTITVENEIQQWQQKIAEQIFSLEIF